MSTPSLVQVRDVHKHFTRGGERIDVLKGVNLEIPNGDFLALMGPSGSGKTTLLNLLGALDQPTSGRISVDGTDITELDDDALTRFRREKVGLVTDCAQEHFQKDAEVDRTRVAEQPTALEVAAHSGSV